MIHRDELLDLVKSHLEGSTEPNPFRPGLDAVPVSGAVISHDDIIAVVDTVLDGWFTEKNDARKFLRAIARYCGVTRGVLCNSGSSADLLAVAGTAELYGYTRGKIVTCATGFPTTVGAIILNGFTPLFVDVDPLTLNPDQIQLEEAINMPGVVGCIQAHTLGFPFDVQALKSNKPKSAFIIEDACDALGAQIDGVNVGHHGDCATLSFFPAHHITTGEGGAVVTKSKELETLLDSYRSWGKDCYCLPGFDNTCGKRFEHTEFVFLPPGWDHKYTFSRVGYNLKMTEMQATLGLSQMKRIDEFVSIRRKNWASLDMALRPYNEFIFGVEHAPRTAPSPFGYAITVATSKFTAQELVQYLETHKIRTRPVFAGNILRQPMMGGVDYEAPFGTHNSDYVMERSFWIGCHPQITDAHIEYVAQVFEDFFKEKGLV